VVKVEQAALEPLGRQGCPQKAIGVPLRNFRFFDNVFGFPSFGARRVSGRQQALVCAASVMALFDERD
jgi:hypothetical protein